MGGSFVWPPAGIDVASLKKVVFIAGGMGVNPMMSMLSWISEQETINFEVQVLYSVKKSLAPMAAETILFLERIARIFQGKELAGELKLFLTDTGLSYGASSIAADGLGPGREIPCQLRRMTCEPNVDMAPVNDGALAVGADKVAAVIYVCGPPAMTDQFVAYFTGKDGLGMVKERVLFEKWW